MKRAISSAVLAFRGSALLGPARTAVVAGIHQLPGARATFAANKGMNIMFGAGCGDGACSMGRWGSDAGMHTSSGALPLRPLALEHRSLARPLLGQAGCHQARAMSTREFEYQDSVGRTLDPPPDPKTQTALSKLWTPLRMFRTWYTLYRLKGDQFPGVIFNEGNFLAEAEKTFGALTSAIESSDVRRMRQYVTDRVYTKVKKVMPERDRKKGPRERVQVRITGSKIVQARIAHMIKPADNMFAQIMCDITVGSDPPHVKRVVFDRPMHQGRDGKWIISEFS
mmetsp:Transcript_7581/g.14894  ORF Transcript_7581/g.14894 Transcript_7581/m.14894 type:complete len:282 (+) Transcript_7581:63-908(+)|eukprot:CAMPEP_0173391218 /NCGR_PEP_ID=MMETSP1356-20130122/17830_1 /TAXON_ID=77927 ORGANISM="Hemiselmis virescens, Strain PCC157" /NCGR_SAMPLE_ID=MMETSP1356 /ASSEMBLY_ACC=CAM_ASM_000847 /LENGTH=281 /DNA_ID=CAMNT_0014348793 /DNA_START=62 /DNA_END=907 /DNA_ORIENTATION=+